jgi:Domain of unknown function (DUF2017)
MSRFRATHGGASARFSLGNAELLAGLARQLATLVSDRDEAAPDPALARLLPDAYRDSAEDAAEFRRFTEEELGDEKVRGALALAASLEPVPGEKKVTVELDAAQAFAWLRSLNDIRLAYATRIGINDTGGPTAGSHLNFAIYNWLGYLQETLVQAVDR